MPLHGEATVLDCLRAMRRPGESFDYEFAAEPSLLHRIQALPPGGVAGG